jgi:hypothetical protein
MIGPRSGVPRANLAGATLVIASTCQTRDRAVPSRAAMSRAVGGSRSSRYTPATRAPIVDGREPMPFL